jgi:O-antigen/teichoic acid export membrane protein
VFEIRILPTLFSNFLIFIFLVLLFFPKIQNFKFDKSFMTFTLYSSFFGTLHSFVTYLLSSIEKIFFILSNKIASLGVYSITLSIAIVLDIFTIVLDSYWGPQITKLLHLNDHTLINRKIYFYSIYFFIIVLSFLLLFPVLLSFFPNEYKVENFNYVMLSFSSYFLFLYKLKLPILYYEGLNKIISKYSFFILFIITPIGYFLIQYYEITGAVITHLILNMLRFLVVEFFLFKNYRQLSFDFKKLILPTLLIFIILLTESNQIFIILSVFIYILFYTKYFIKIKFKLL